MPGRGKGSFGGFQFGGADGLLSGTELKEAYGDGGQFEDRNMAED